MRWQFDGIDSPPKHELLPHPSAAPRPAAGTYAAVSEAAVPSSTVRTPQPSGTPTPTEVHDSKATPSLTKGPPPEHHLPDPDRAAPQTPRLHIPVSAIRRHAHPRQGSDPRHVRQQRRAHLAHRPLHPGHIQVPGRRHHRSRRVLPLATCRFRSATRVVDHRLGLPRLGRPMPDRSRRWGLALFPHSG